MKELLPLFMVIKEVLKNLSIAKKSLNDTPLLMLLELQNSLYKGDQNNTFTLWLKC